MSQSTTNSYFGVNFEDDMLSSTLEAFSPTAVSDVDFGRSLLPRWQRTQAKTKHQGSENESSHGNIQPSHYMPKDKSDHFNSATHPKELLRGDGRLEAQRQEDRWCSNQMNETKEKEMSSSLLSGQKSDTNPSQDIDAKILTYQEKAPQPSEGYVSTLRVLYTGEAASVKDSSESLNKCRVVSQSAERILDAPELRDCFYSNPLDWGQSNIVAIGLGSSVYLWNTATTQADLLQEKDKEDCSVCSVRWTHTGTHLAVGMSDNTVTLWDVSNKKILRRIRGHSARVGCLAWNNFILSTGSSDSTIMNHDVRAKESLLATLKGHEQEICGLQWDSNTDGTYLASGGNDNVVCVWEHNQLRTKEPTPKCVLRESRAAVKALAWCPWQKALLATGGGTGDMHIRFYDVNSGNCFNEVNTQSQVCSLQWNPFDKEILSSHGFSKYQLSIWKYPSLIKTHDLTGHTSRVLHTALSPDGTMICSGAADETLRFWKVFEKAKATTKYTQDILKKYSNSGNLKIR